MGNKELELVPIFTRARELLRRGWIKGRQAEDSAGMPTPPGSPTATCWCLYGALQCAAAGADMFDIMSEVRRRTGSEYVTSWNDDPDRTKEEVLALLDQILASLDEPKV